MVAALYVATGGCYYGLDDVDPWDLARDARTYAGPHPVRFASVSPRSPTTWRLARRCLGHST